ncbi:MAG: hypothetical protein C0598_10735 [Marinilabiliales bacterium]|nr:MAG: hypothetical protein C0598_10735 [Marinilabiliales bacterium]
MKNLIILTLIITTLISCSKQDTEFNSSSTSNKGNWLVDINDIIHFDSEKDPINSIDKPEFDFINYSDLNDNDEILAYYYNGIVHIYPISVLDVHEIVNDSIDDHYFVVSHCPLTNSSLAWNRKINESITSFGVSGKLYKENLILYDRKTGSHWSQMLSKCINGDHIGYLAKTRPLLKTTFSTIKLFFPYALVLKHENCDDSGCIVGLKSKNDEPEDSSDSEIVEYERYFGVVDNDRATLFPLSHIDDKISIEHFVVFQNKLVKITSKELSINLVFNAENKSFTPINDSLPVIMKDNEGNQYNLFGVVVSGDNLGYRLTSPTSYYAHTFAWKTIFNGIEIIE